LQDANALTRDALQVKFRSADFNGWQTAYAFDVFRGAPDATSDSGESRKAFLDSVASFRSELARVQHDPLTPAQKALATEVGTQFDQFMALDRTIISDYRTGSPLAVAAANKLVLVDEIAIFEKLATATDKLVATVKQVADDNDGDHRSAPVRRVRGRDHAVDRAAAPCAQRPPDRHRRRRG
jgi:methyl-accepting chemotaxis protein